MFAAVASIDSSARMPGKDIRGTKLIIGYVIIVAFLVISIALSIAKGRDEHAQPAIGGFYTSDSACLGKEFKLVQSGQFVDLSGGGVLLTARFLPHLDEPSTGSSTKTPAIYPRNRVSRQKLASG